MTNHSPKLKLNCDMGESYGKWNMGNDEAVIPFVHMANIACGFHASDPDTMAKTIQLAVKHNVSIGAHPSYLDLLGFGRRSIPHSTEQISHLISYQVGAIQSLAQFYDTQVDYVKPHGALYNDMMANLEIFEAIVQAIMPMGLPLMVLAKKDNTPYLDIADEYNVPLLFEAFADRAYKDDGSLVPRQNPNAVHQNPEDIFYQAMQLANFGTVTTAKGHTLELQADTLCVHGDNEQSIAVVRKIFNALNSQ
ncbi:MAG: 5-oxoprolinase subunit PxpA [Vibrio sp.]